MAHKPLRIGVMLETVQLSDIVSIDIFSNISKDYVDTVAKFFPEFTAFLDHAIPVEWFYISASTSPAPMTPTNFKVIPNVTYDDCPRDLDIVIQGGPMPTTRSEASNKFMQEAWTKTRVWMTTCIGTDWLASSGVLKGHKATTNRGFLPMVKNLHPEVEWLDQRWVIDEKPYDGEGKGELWSSGGAGAGVDMIATYALKNFDPALVKGVALGPLEFDPQGPQGQFYAS